MKDKLYFYSKSADKPPGKGANEYVHDVTIYAGLPKDFRKMLSNFHVAPFEYEGLTFRTIEHAFQAKKIALENVAIAYKFTVESGDIIGQGDGAMAQKHRKLVMLDKAQLACWDHIKEDIMYEAALAKYTQNPEAARVLKATGNAELWHIVSRRQPVRFKHLEKIRNQLKNTLPKSTSREQLS